jgi:adenylate cyclase
MIPVLTGGENTDMTTEAPTRRLSAIMVADIAGFSSLMERDEVGTFSRVRNLLDSVAAPMIVRYGGRVIKTTGDGFLAEFPSATAALKCGVELQDSNYKRELEGSSDTRLHLRIGINSGDVIVDGDDVAGDGVNIAARLESLSPLDGVCVSGAVRDQVREDIGVDFHDLGQLLVKNITRPIRAYKIDLFPESDASDAKSSRKPARGGIRRLANPTAIAALLATLALAGTIFVSKAPSVVPAATLSIVPTVAVLPLDADESSAYLGDGIAQDILASLTRLSGIHVIARDSVIKQRGRSPEEVARELKVRYVLKGTIRRLPGEWRVTTELMDTESRRQVWAGRYEVPEKDIFKVQDDIVEQIVAATSAQVTRSELDRIRRKPTEDLTAYDLFLKGRDLRWRYERESNLEARRLLEKAVQTDEGFAEAHVQLGRTWLTGVNLGWDGKEGWEQARIAAVRAIAIDGSTSSAHAILARVLVPRRQFDEAHSAATKALELNPNDAEGLQLIAEVYTFVGRAGDALVLMARAMKLNPHYPPIYAMVAGRAALYSGQFDQAVGSLRECASRAPNIWPCRAYLAAALVKAGREDEAKTELEEYRRLVPSATTRTLSEQATFRNPTDVELLVGSLKKIGLPAE